MKKSIKGWHFLRQDCRLSFGDGRLIRAGTTVTVPGPPVLYARGLHASRRVMDALQLAPGPVVCRVVVSGEIVKEDDIFAGTRRYVKNDVLWAAVAAKRAWLADEITDEQLQMAFIAARSVARSTTSRSPTRSAGYSAGYSAASSAARSAAYSAANSVAAASAADRAAESAARSAWTSASKYSAYATETEAQDQGLAFFTAELPFIAW